FGALWPSTDGWKELGSLWVHPQFRDSGHASDIFMALMDMKPEETGVFLITKNPKVRHLALEHGWQSVTQEEWEEPVPWAASCGPCDRWKTEQEKFVCQYRARIGECELYYLPPETWPQT
ncbi:MAG: hypothetical protein NUV96_00150, partial [Candidatus Colwellbacteria bacterium]|nr:hypothetical protein [Candidatus Colwellbacteria bacterium]